MCRDLEEFTEGHAPLSQLLTLSGVTIDGADRIVPDRPIVGRCLVGIDDVSQTHLRNCALRCEFYGPDLKRPVTDYCHLDEALRREGHELRFTLPAFESAKNPWKVEGTMVLFLQMVTADDLTPMDGVREISNTAIALVEFKQQASS